jgi:hypothetical protein
VFLVGLLGWESGEWLYCAWGELFDGTGSSLMAGEGSSSPSGPQARWKGLVALTQGPALFMVPHFQPYVKLEIHFVL